MINFIATNRFNFIDAVAISMAAGYAANQDWSAAVITLLIGVSISLIAETWA